MRAQKDCRLCAESGSSRWRNGSFFGFAPDVVCNWSQRLGYDHPRLLVALLSRATYATQLRSATPLVRRRRAGDRMTFDSGLSPFIKPLAFAIAALPMVVDNLRTGQITNWNNAIIFLVGLGVLALGPTLRMSDFHLLAPSLWTLVALVPFVMFALKWIRGGAAKFLIALLPWLSPGEYLCVTITGFVLAGLVSLVWRRKEMQIAPPIVLIGLIVQTAGIAASRQY